MKKILEKYPFLKTIIAAVVGAILTYLGINTELPVNYIGKTPKVDTVKVDSTKTIVDTNATE